VRVNDVDVTDYVEAELDRRIPERVQVRAMRTAEEYRAAWVTIEQRWAQTISRAERLPEPLRHDRVDDEWSLVETLRHLVFATDAWVLRAVLDAPAPYDRIGLTQPGYPAEQAAAIGLDLAVDPSYAKTIRVRGDRQTRVRELLDRLRDDDLDRTTNCPPAPGYPAQERTVGYCLRVVMNEECAHRGYAERDLAMLEDQHDPH
jgi:uncharacterized damage-inducible protein DinB